MNSEEIYDNLTLEEKMLVDERLREWAREYGYIDTIIPRYIVELARDAFINEIKERNDRRNRKPSVGRTNHK